MIKQFLFLLACTPFTAMSQVGVGTNNVDPSAKFQIESANKGFLQPRIALTGTTDVATIASPATGLTVYNTATAGSGATAITPGVHYFDGAKWVRMESSVINAGAGTTVTGNGTNASPYVVNSTGGSTPATFVSGQFSSTEQVFNRQYTVDPDGVRFYGPSIRIGRITLPEGKWELNLHTETWPSTLGQLGTTAATQGNCRIKMQFWLQNDQTDNQILFRGPGSTGMTYNSQITGNFPTTGFQDTLLWGSAAFTFTLASGTGTQGTNGIADTYDSYCKGSFLINNTSGGNKTYYIYAAELFNNCNPSGPSTTGSMPGYLYINNRNYPSNRLFATKIN
jgi:hypothetical protein